MALVCGVAWCFFAVRFLVQGFWSSGLGDLFFGLACLVVLGLARRPDPPQAGLAHALIGINAIGLASVVPLTGGPHSTAFLFFPCVALMAFHHVHWKAASAWTLLTMALLGASTLVPIPDIPTYRPGDHELLFDAMMAILVTGSLALAARRVHDHQTVLLESARGQAHAALEIKRRLLATVSHELRTPLVGTLGSAELLQRELDDPGHLLRVRTIIECCEDLQRLLDDLLDQAALREGGTSLVPTATDPAALVVQVLELFRASAEAKGLELRLEGRAPRVVVDARRLKQVFINLVGNAVKFTASGSVTVRLSHDEGRLQVEVIDTGIGIGDTLRVLEPFEQDADGVGQRYGGTGLGLSISQGLLRLMEGDLELESQRGRGTLARAWLRAPTLAVGSLTVLVVEDNPVGARLTQEMLRRLGHRSELAGSLGEARRLLGRGVFDVVLLDLRLPDGLGLELIPSLSRDLRVVAVTANAEERGRCLQDGAHLFLPKPFRLEELEAVLSA
jgi:signal transduction histidine kinase